MQLEQQQVSPEDVLSASLERNLRLAALRMGGSGDLRVRRIQLQTGEERAFYGAILYIDGLSKLHTVLQSLLDETGNLPFLKPDSPQAMLNHLKQSVITEGIVAEVDSWPAFFRFLLKGNSVLLLDGCNFGLAVGTQDPKVRAIEEPNTQSVVRGPREGFTEQLNWNTSMVRRKITSPDLWLESMEIGRITQTEVAVMYLHNLVSEEVLHEVRRRLAAIDIDSVLESNYIEEQIQDAQLTPFPTIFNTERPDVVAAALLEGRVAILVDGTPFVLLVPAVFTQFFQASEDYYHRADFASLIRLLRFFAFILATLTPSFYIAITTFHQEMLPTTLLFNLASQREGVPFPAFIEALMMEITFEILREASVRMPRTVGQAISIVGTLVIGQAAVEAGLVSAAMVIVVSITAISNFVLPAFNMGISARIIRFLMMMLGASFGLFGIFLGLLAVVLHLCSLSSFGVPYMSPLAPFVWSDQKDTMLRLPFKWLITRPKSMHPKDLVRQRNSREGEPS